MSINFVDEKWKMNNKNLRHLLFKGTWIMCECIYNCYYFISFRYCFLSECGWTTIIIHLMPFFYAMKTWCSGSGFFQRYFTFISCFFVTFRVCTAVRWMELKGNYLPKGCFLIRIFTRQKKKTVLQESSILLYFLLMIWRKSKKSVITGWVYKK